MSGSFRFVFIPGNVKETVSARNLIKDGPVPALHVPGFFFIIVRPDRPVVYAGKVIINRFIMGRLLHGGVNVYMQDLIPIIRSFCTGKNRGEDDGGECAINYIFHALVFMPVVKTNGKPKTGQFT